MNKAQKQLKDAQNQLFEAVSGRDEKKMAKSEEVIHLQSSKKSTHCGCK